MRTPEQLIADDCAVSDCDRTRCIRGWCSMHYQRWKRHGDPITIARSGPQRRQCQVDNCDILGRSNGWCEPHWYRVSRYGDPEATSIRMSPGTYTECRAEGCGSIPQARGWCPRHYQHWRKYGLTPDDYASLLAAQGGGCALCGGTWGLAVDHDHTANKVRGILCSPCNRALGKLGDTPESLRTVLLYLEGDDA